MPITGYTGVQTFSATRAEERNKLGERVTAWIAGHPTVTVVDKVVLQSSDKAYHAITIAVFFKERVLTEDEKFDAMGEEVERHPIGGGGRRFG